MVMGWVGLYTIIHITHKKRERERGSVGGKASRGKDLVHGQERKMEWKILWAMGKGRGVKQGRSKGFFGQKSKEKKRVF